MAISDFSISFYGSRSLYVGFGQIKYSATVGIIDVFVTGCTKGSINL